MDAREVLQRRLAANGLAGPRRSTPAEVVGHLLAVQSQDVQPSAWSIAQRCTGVDEAAVERARADGTLVRTHVLRTTWHDVRAEDLRWLLQLTGARVQAQMRGVERQIGVDAAALATGRRVLERVLDGRALTRAQVAAALADGGLELAARPLGYLLGHLELDGVLCSGPRAGRWQTYALLEQRVPPAAPKDDAAAVAELVLRFLAGHGPATVQDLAWWSSLRISDLRGGLHDLGDAVARDVVDGLELWRAVDAAEPTGSSAGVQLVQLYDEHLVAFTASKSLVDPDLVTPGGNRPYLAVVLADGLPAGSWRRRTARGRVPVDVVPLRPLDLDQLAAAVDAYGAFLGLPVELHLQA